MDKCIEVSTSEKNRCEKWLDFGLTYAKLLKIKARQQESAMVCMETSDDDDIEIISETITSKVCESSHASEKNFVPGGIELFVPSYEKTAEISESPEKISKHDDAFASDDTIENVSKHDNAVESDDAMEESESAEDQKDALCSEGNSDDWQLQQYEDNATIIPSDTKSDDDVEVKTRSRKGSTERQHQSSRKRPLREFSDRTYRKKKKSQYQEDLKQRPQENNKTNKECFVFLRQLPLTGCEESTILRTLKDEVGEEVLSVRCLRERYTGSPRGIGYALCKNKTVAQKLIDSKIFICNKRIQIQKYRKESYKKQENLTVHIYNFPSKITKSRLKKKISEIVDAKDISAIDFPLMKNGKGLGYAYVRLENHVAFMKVLAQHKKFTIGGMRVIIQTCSKDIDIPRRRAKNPVAKRSSEINFKEPEIDASLSPTASDKKGSLNNSSITTDEDYQQQALELVGSAENYNQVGVAFFDKVSVKVSSSRNIFSSCNSLQSPVHRSSRSPFRRSLRSSSNCSSRSSIHCSSPSSAHHSSRQSSRHLKPRSKRASRPSSSQISGYSKRRSSN